MKKLKFTKMVASGNDFVVIDRLPLAGLRLLARRLCDRKFGIGADGLLAIGGSRKADIRMRIFNADGSEAEMCGNGARCAALYSSAGKEKKVRIETKAGIIHSECGRDFVRIRLTEPKDMRIGIPLKVNGRLLRVNFINTGVPHAVVFVEGLEKIDAASLGRAIRYHKEFLPAGANVNFVEVLDRKTISARTYERGVEDETLACGTGSVASSLITAYSLKLNSGSLNVRTRGGEVLKVYFERAKDGFLNVWLEGRAKIVYKGEYYV